MTRAAWERTITDNAGNVLTGVQISVFQADGSTPATIYGQQAGGGPIGNPFNTGLQTSAKFYAEAGRYVIRASKDGNTKEFIDVDVAGRAVRDDLGSAAYLTAATSRTDATQGRALRVGDFGIGSDYRLMITDANALHASGHYTVPATWEGSVEAGTSGSNQGYLDHYEWDGNYFLQRFTDVNGPFTTRERRKNNGVISDWVANYNTRNALGTVGFSGGQNIGAIIEHGSNASGEFTKFADGTMIARYIRSAALGMASYSSGLHVGDFIWQFPAAFISGPVIAGTHTDSVTKGWLSCSGSTPTQATIAAFSSAANNSGTFSTVIAIGRWRA